MQELIRMKHSYLSRLIAFAALILAAVPITRAEGDTYWFIVNVKPEYSGYNVWYLDVKLTPKGSDEPYATVQVDQDFNAEFQNVPAGEYNIGIDANVRGLQNYSKDVEISAENQHLYVTLGEYLIAPYNVTIGEPTFNADDTYNVNISWNDGGTINHLPYLYDLRLNGEGVYQTSGCNYPFEGLKPGNYTVTIWGEAPSFENTPATSVEFSLPDPADNGMDSGADIVIGDKEAFSYFDLNGNPVNRDSAAPGIYICKTPEGAIKVIIP